MDANSITNILSRYTGASASAAPASVQQDYTQVASQANHADLASGLSQAFRSNDTPAFGQMVGTLFGNSNPDQRAGILNQILGSVGPGALASVLGGVLSPGQTTVTPAQAQQISPQAVQAAAEQAQQHNPSIIDQASDFYAKHPTLVQALGAGSLALIMSHLSQRQS